MITYRCPYCNCADFRRGHGKRKRSPNHQMAQCRDCDGYVVMLPTGLVFPLTDRSDPEADAVTSIMK